MTTSHYGAPQDGEISPYAFIPENIITATPEEALPCIKPSTSLDHIDLYGSSQGICNFRYCQMDADIVPSQAISTTMAENSEAARPFSINTSPIPSVLDQDSITALPTTIATLEEDVQRKIFEIVLVKQRGIYPRYRCGMFVDGPRSPVDFENTMDPGVSIYKNVDLCLLQVSRSFNKICCEIFYGQNDFFFCDAHICRWWAQHIGIKNFSRIRSLTLGLGCGFTHGRWEERSAIDLSQEEVWLSVLCWMQNRHRLHYFRVQIRGWNKPKFVRGFTNKDRAQLTWRRQQIMSVLQRYRGIKEAEISCDGSRWLTSREMQKLALLMQQRREDVIKPTQISLFELINSLRLAREKEEKGRRVRRRKYSGRKY